MKQKMHLEQTSINNADYGDMKRLVFVDESGAGEPSGKLKKRSFDRWPFIAFTLIFISFYASVLAGWLRPIADMSILSRLEPIIFVIIGFYFGRSSSIDNENALQEQWVFESRRAEHAIAERDVLREDFGILTEKIRSVRLLLDEWPLRQPESGVSSAGEDFDSSGNATLIQERISTVKQILGS